jgi:hypothetical protein
MDFPIATFVSVGDYDILFLVGWCTNKIWGCKNQPLHQHGDLTNKKIKLRNELLYQQNLELKHPNLSVWTWLNYPKIGLETTSTMPRPSDWPHTEELPSRCSQQGNGGDSTQHFPMQAASGRIRMLASCWVVKTGKSIQRRGATRIQGATKHGKIWEVGT